MPRYDATWMRTHAGATSSRRMSAILTRITRSQYGKDGLLAVTRMARDRDPFAVLVSCLISLRTKDEVTDVAAPRLLTVAPTALELARLRPERIARLIYPAGFYRTKGKTLRQLARTLVDRHAGRVPDTLEGLLELQGVGRKTANLVLTLGHGKPGICVDTHVHRISNRVGYAITATPDDTEHLLRERLPRRWWMPINDLLVTHGRTICSPLSPRCSLCPAADLCPRTGVERMR